MSSKFDFEDGQDYSKKKNKNKYSKKQASKNRDRQKNSRAKFEGYDYEEYKEYRGSKKHK